MNQLEAREVHCPYCAERIELTIDCSISSQRYIEDCQVCCRPIIMTIHIPEPDVLMVSVSRESD